MIREFVVYESKRRLLLLTFLALVMVTGSLFVLSISFEVQDNFSNQKAFKIINLFLGLFGATDIQHVVNSSLYFGIGILGTIIFGFAMLYSTKQLFSRRKLVIVNENGFYDFSSALAIRDFIKWESVEKIELVIINGQQLISVYLLEGDTFINTLPALKRIAMRGNLKFGFGQVTITVQTAINVTGEQLNHIMNSFFEGYKFRLQSSQ
ncbi:STM3941 family protein [Solibacillus sp. FSL H8-0538]|uniref:STM3941 family protein n=1 Tax=Solibacillus sp. FSL H8-0538 TaxID=2921400 RepID=UPI0030F5557C